MSNKAQVDFTAKRVTNKSSIIFVVTAVLLGVLALLAVLQWQSNLVDEGDLALVRSQVEDRLPGGVSLTGSLVFVSAFDRTLFPQRFPVGLQYDLSANTTEIFFPRPVVSLSLDLGRVVAATGFVEDSPALDQIEPIVFDDSLETFVSRHTSPGFHDTDIAVSPGRLFYSYSYRTELYEEGAESGFGDFAYWIVDVHDFDTGERVFRVEGATGGHWLNNDTDLLILRRDGLYLIDLTSMTILPVLTRFDDLSADADFILSKDLSLLILTVATEGWIMLFDATINTETRVFELELNTILDQYESPWRHPVISPDKEYFAVYRGVREGSESSESSVEIWSLSELDIVSLIRFPDLDPLVFKLEAWLD